MRLEELKAFFEEAGTIEIAFEGKCHVCGCDVTVLAKLEDDETLTISGGAIYKPWPEDQIIFLKCPECFQKDSVLRYYQPVEVYSRIVGYFRPIKQWNPGKQAEYRERKNFELDKGER